MTKEQKDLLIKDLSARLPYGVKFLRESWNYELDQEMSVIEVLEDIDKDGYINNTKVYNVEDIKPYLFPLSSMTEEQWNNAPRVNLTEFTFESLKCGCFTLASYTCENDLCDLVEFINWLIENHFDINGLIPRGLANDATNLNIYSYGTRR